MAVTVCRGRLLPLRLAVGVHQHGVISPSEPKPLAPRIRLHIAAHSSARQNVTGRSTHRTGGPCRDKTVFI